MIKWVPDKFITLHNPKTFVPSIYRKICNIGGFKMIKKKPSLF